MEGVAMVDGRLVALADAVIPVTDVGFTHGFSIFETLFAGKGHDLAPHLQRLRRSGESSLVSVPSDALLREEIDIVRSKIGDEALVRVTITGDGRRIVSATPIDYKRRHAPVRCVRGEHVEQAFIEGSVKHRSRMGWTVAVRRAQVDEILFVDTIGRFTEGTTCSVLAIIDGALWTAPWDGRILVSTTLARILERCVALGIPVQREGAPADGPFDALYVASTTRGIAPVIELDGEVLCGWDPIGRSLAGI